MRLSVPVLLSGLLLALVAGCSGLSRPDELVVVRGDILLSPPTPAAVELPGSVRSQGNANPDAPARKSGG